MPLSQTNAAVAVSVLEAEEQTALDELVRTGEASRLRRRGAINGGHGRSRSAVYGTGAAAADTSSGVDYPWGRVPTQAYYAPPPWAEASPPAEPVIYPAWSSEAEQGKVDDETDNQRGAGNYFLYCGFEEWDFSSPYDEPYELSPFPSPFSSSRSQASSSKNAVRRCFRKSTGCGALIHKRGTPRTRDGTWHAKGKATECVVALDKMYFKHGGVPKQFACGCRWHGVGCAICGNPLGNVYIPCQAASAAGATDSQPQQRRSSTSRSTSSRAPSSRTSGSQHHVYTFFCNALSSSPAFDFPERCFSSQQQLPTELPVPPPLSGASSSSDYLPLPIRPPERRSAAASSAPAPPAATGAGFSDGLSASARASVLPPPPLSWTPSSVSEDSAEYGAYDGFGMQEVEVTAFGADLDAYGVYVGFDEPEPEYELPGSPDKSSYEAMLWPAR